VNFGDEPQSLFLGDDFKIQFSRIMNTYFNNTAPASVGVMMKPVIGGFRRGQRDSLSVGNEKWSQGR